MGGDHFLNLQPGTIVNGRYEVVKCLGTGSMGMVYACRHRELAGHIVAMKVLFAEVARDEVAAARFRNEIVASYGVSHPNVVRAYEYFRDGKLIAFTMEYIGGGDLADRITGDEDIPIEEIIEMLCQMASGVQAIHEAGIIHRDLKPENILITSQGGVKITDFGIARTGTGPKLTEHGGVVGTIDYVSPEYLERGQVDARSDIYSLGVLAYEMITSEAPFKGKSVIETMTMRLRTDPEPAHHLRPDCPVALSNIILKAMARDPEDRYQAASEILEDLEALKRGRGPESRDDLEPTSTTEARIASSVNAPSEAKGEGSRGSTTIPSEMPLVGDLEEYNRATHLDLTGRPGSGSPGEKPSTGVGTVQLDAGAVAKVTENAEKVPEDEENGYYDSGASLESVLRQGNSYNFGEEWSDGAAPSIAVSESSLSTERIKELSSDFYQPNPGVIKSLLLMLAICFLGFGVGYLIWEHYVVSAASPGDDPVATGYESFE